MQALCSLMKYVRKNYLLWVCGLLIPAFFSTATNIYFAKRLQDYVAQITGQSVSFQSISQMLLFALLILIVLSCIDDIGLYVFSLFSAYTENELKCDYYNSMLYTSLKNIQRFSQGELITRYNTDIEQCANIVSYDIFGVVYPLVVGTGYIVAVFRADFRIGFIMLLLGLIVILLNFAFVHRMKCAQTEILQAKESFTSGCNDTIHGKMSIRQYSANKLMCKKTGEAAEKLYEKECKAVRLEARKMLTSDGLANCCTYLLTPLACVIAAYGYMEIPVVLFIHQLCRCFIMYTQNFAVSFIHYSEHALSFERIRLIMDFESENRERNVTGCENFPKRNLVSFRNVSVTYGNHEVLKNVSFEVCSGECIGIIGESGSGKSTLVKALMQMIDYQGEIYIGEENCKNISVQELRENIAYSPEHNDVFPDTIYNNIRYGNLNASRDDICLAAKRVGITCQDAFFERNAGEKGELLSGGQKQKISIARALLKNAPIFIFDEPTAALDAHSESKIVNTILALKQEGKCILLITHKTSTLRAADKVFRIEGGEIFPVQEIL